MTQYEVDKMTLLQRAAGRTPRFFQILKVIGLSLAAASGALLMAPVALPAIVSTVAGYVAVAGSVATAISQVTVDTSDDE